MVPDKPSYQNRVAYHATLLGGVALLAGTALIIANQSTRQEISKRLDEDTRASLQQVLPQQLYDNNPLEDTLTLPEGDITVTVYRARKAGRVTACAYGLTTNQGYNGTIKLLMGVDRDGTILGVRVLSHAETPGLGDRIEKEKSDWILGFDGRSINNPGQAGWKVKKDGGEFDQFTGATITPRAVVKAVHEGLEMFEQNRELLLANTQGAEAATSTDRQETTQ
jgi:electron transport complex protein RnfG